jgi:hypothetical protein
VLEARPILPHLTGLVGKERARIHARLAQRIVLQVGCLPVVVTRHPPGAHRHVRKTTLCTFPYDHTIRQSFSYQRWWVLGRVLRAPGPVSGTTCFSAGLVILVAEISQALI